MAGLTTAAVAPLPDVLRYGLLGDATRPGLQAVSRLVADAEAALQEGRLQSAQSCLDVYFAEATRFHGLSAKAAPVDQFMCRAHFAAGQLVSQLSSSFKGQQLLDAVLEAVGHIMKGVELAAANPRYSHLVYNGSVYYWHAARPLQCDKLRHHLLHSQEKLCQALEKVEGQPAWRVRHLLSLALCQLSDEGKPEEVPKILAKALDLATAANLQPLRAEVLALQTHHQTLQAARAAAAKPGGPAAAGKAPAAAAAAPAPPAAAAAKQAAPAGKRKPGDAPAAGTGKADVDGALAALQWVLSARPDAAVAEQQLQAALKLVDIRSDKPGNDAQLLVVGRIGWVAAVCGVRQLAEQCARRATTSQELRPRVWADLTRLLLNLQAAPEAALGIVHCSNGAGAVLDPAAVRARREVLEGADEAVAAFVKLGDVEGIHNSAVLAWNAGLPLLQPGHRSIVKPAFTAVGKALEAVGSPWTKLRAALHLEVAKAEADADFFMKGAKEVTTSLSLNYPSSADMAAVCGYERPLDRYLEPMARAAQLRGVAPVQLSSPSSSGGDGVATRPDDDVVLLLERAKDSKSAPLRSEYLQKAINKLALLPAVPPPDGPATTQALQQQLQAARTRTQLWADIIELAWHCQLEPLVRSALPFVLEAAWQPVGDKEMLLLQARAALVGADAAKAALVKLNAELVVPAHYTPSLSLHTHNPGNNAGSEGSASTTKGRAASAKASVEQKTGSIAEDMQRLVADLYLQSMRLSVAAGGHPWLVMNAALAAWNTYLPLMQRERCADLADILLPVLQHLLQEKSSLEPNQLVMLAEAAAKAAEHTALTRLLQQQHSAQRPPTSQALQPAATGSDAASVVSSQPVPGCRVSELPWYKPLVEARGATAGLDAMVFLTGAADVLQLLIDTAAACQQALTRAAAASEPQGLIQAYARLQQLQGKSVVVPPGAPAAMADTSKLLELIEGLTATAPDTGAPPAAPPAGRLSSAASAAAPARASASGAKGAPAAPVVSKAEQDIRAAMSLLAAMPSVNLQLWAQLARAAGRHGFWLLARECANAALGALPATKRQLHTITTAADVPEVTAQGWYWLSVAEMQQGQATLSLLHAAAGTGAASTLSLRHSALQHFATAARLASFIRRPDLAEAAARLAYNAATAPGALLETELTRAAAVPCLTKVAVALNATRPADISFQVRVNLLLLECLAAAGRSSDARRHVEALHRSLPLSKQKGPAAAAALEGLASWRATCLVQASSGRAMEDMTRLLAELSTPQAKACAWLAFAQASSTPAEQVSARQSALAALDNLPPAAKVEYQLEFAQWLVTCPAASAPAADAGWTPEQLLLDAVSTLREAQERAGSQLGDCSSSGSSSGKGLPAGTAAGTHRSRRSRTTADAAGGFSKADAVPWTRQMEQRIRAHVLLSQVAARLEDRQQHLLQAQECTQQMLTQSPVVAGAEVALLPTQQDPLLLEGSPGYDSTQQQTSSQLSGSAASTAAMSSSGQADAASTVTAPEQLPKAVVLTLDFLARPATAAKVASAVTRDTDRCMQGLAPGNSLPTGMLDWAVWLPTDGLLHQLSSPVSDPCNQPPAGTACQAPAVASAATGRADAHSTATHSTAAAGAVLSRSCIPAPEMLLANLELLSEQLQASGCHAAALPVVQLARLVAVVTLNSQVAAAAQALQLSTLCEHLGLSAAAADWLKLAAPEQWPSPEQLQQAEQAQAVQQLAQDVLQQHTSCCAATTTEVVTAATGSSPATEQAQASGFLLDALHSANPATLQAWLNTSTSVQRSGRDSSKPSSAHGTRRPSSAAGAGAAAAVQAAVAGGVQPGKVGVLLAKPLAALTSWVSIARYLVEHAQYTAGQKLCGFALQQARSCKDSQQEAQVLLLQARLALLAQHWEAAVHLTQAAQALGGGVQLWADSVLCYAAARSHMPGRGPADALEALEGGVALLATVARGCPRSCMPIIAAASSRLKQQLARDIAAKAQQQLVDQQDDAACCRSAVQLHSRAVLLTREAAVDAQQAGAVLFHVAAQQQVARLLISQPGSVLTPQQSTSRQGLPAAPVREKAAALEALVCLQAAHGALAAVPSFNHGVPAAQPTLASPLQQAGVHSAPSGRSPTAHMAVSVLTELSNVELLISRLQLRAGQAIQTSAEPDFPRVDGRDPRAVIAFLTAGASSMTDQVDADNAMVHLEHALQHAAEAAEAAAAANQRSQHAAALLALGKAHMLQAHVAMLQQQDNVPAVQPLLDGDGSRSNCANASQADMFEAAWLPWPGGMAPSIPVSAAASAADSTSNTAVAVDGAADGGQAASRLDSASGQALTSPLAAVLPDQPVDCCLLDDSAQPSLQLPAASAEPYQQATTRLHDALQQALQHQQLQTAQEAARALAHCYGQLQPDKAALYLAVAQSCSSAMAMRHSFEEAAAEQHMELLLWRQLEQLEAGWKGASVHDQQVQHMLSLLGVTSKRLQVPQTDALVPVLAQLQPHQRLILLHHDTDKQQLVLAAWGMPVSKTRSGPAAATGCASGPVATAASAHSSSSGGMQSARARTSSMTEPPPPAGIEPSAAAPPPALLASMPCTQQQISELVSAFNAYSRQLQKAIAQAAGQPVPSPIVTTPEVPAGPGAVVSESKKPPAVAAGKAGAKDKGSKDAASEVPPWVPPVPVFPAELNEQWQQLLRQFEAFLQPVSSLFQEAMQQPVITVEAPAPAAKPSTKTSKSAAAPPAGPSGAAPIPLGIQLLLDLQLCELPWEALPALRQSSGSIARCVSLAQLQHLQQPPVAQPAAANSSASSPAAVLELKKLSYLVDPLHLMSSVAEGPRCYCAPLLPSFRQQLADVWGQDWQGFAGSDSQTPREEQLLRPLVGSKGLLVLAPGRLLNYISTQSVAGLDLTSCTAALLFDRLDSPTAAAHQTKVDYQKTAAQRALEGPSQAALLLLLRGVRSVAVAALPGTAHTHLHLASSVLRCLSGAPVQTLQAPSSSLSGASADTGPGKDTALSATTLGEAVCIQRQGLAGFELQALRDAGLVLYGLQNVVLGEGGGISKKAPRKG